MVSAAPGTRCIFRWDVEVSREPCNVSNKQNERRLVVDQLIFFLMKTEYIVSVVARSIT
jgi:hypothetical protein